MVDVGEQAPAPDDEADLDDVQPAGPVVHGDGAVAGEPAAERERVEKLEGEGHEPDEGVDGGHGGVEDEGCEYGAVEVVECLWLSASVSLDFILIRLMDLDMSGTCARG